MRHFSGLVTGFALCLMTAAAAHAEMRVSSFEPPAGFYSARIFAPWIEEVNAKLSPDAKMKLYPGAILGSPVAQADLVKKGVADIALIVPGYTPGVFPKTSVAELPFLYGSAAEATDDLLDLYENGLIAEDFKNYKLIGIFGTPTYGLITPKQGITTPEQIKGWRIRTPSALYTAAVERAGATGTSMPATEVYEALERGVVEATFWNFNASTTFKLYEPAPHFVDLNLTVTPIVVLMNKARYERLSPEDKAVIDEWAGRKFSAWVGKESDDYETSAREALLAKGAATFTTPTEAEMEAWRKAFADVPEIWLETTKGLEPDAGKALLARVGR